MCYCCDSCSHRHCDHRQLLILTIVRDVSFVICSRIASGDVNNLIYLVVVVSSE